jgi:hypothetical protein
MWKHDLMHGEGEFEKDGSLYKGEFFQGERRVVVLDDVSRLSPHDVTTFCVCFRKISWPGQAQVCRWGCVHG